MWRRWVAGTASTSGVTFAVIFGFIPYLVLLVGILALFGMWIWCDDRRTERFSSSLDRLSGRKTRLRKAKTPPAVEAERGPRAA